MEAQREVYAAYIQEMAEEQADAAAPWAAEIRGEIAVYRDQLDAIRPDDE